MPSTAKSYQGLLKTDDQYGISLYICSIHPNAVLRRVAETVFGTGSDLVPEDIAFPVGFAWGAATAAYQIEEGWNADGKGPNVWDTFTHQGGDRVFKNQTGDVACGSYTLWEEDLKCIKQLGLTHYRFSLSWSRLLPDGTTGFINQKGVNYYSKIINNLENDILLTYHFGLPQSLEDEGGWRSEKIIETFDIHAKYYFRTFGDVITINEPYIVAIGGCEKGIARIGTRAYKAAYNVIKAHAKAHCCDKILGENNGFVSIALNSDCRTSTNSVADQKATKGYLSFTLDGFVRTVFTDSEYPAIMKSWISAMHSKQGYLSSRLLEFTKEEKIMIMSIADFFALMLNLRPRKCRQEAVSMGYEAEQIMDPSWPIATGSLCLAVAPWDLHWLLCYIKDTYNNPIIYITDKGLSRSDPALLDDSKRWEYFRLILQKILKEKDFDAVREN
ncbi:LOW QUALITY PROTEIN: cytosolic beta-glucosidase-like [Spheniscus humboldti]